jgi:hypothetical protein
MKKENGKNPTIVLLSSKLFLASGIRGFRIFVRKAITANMINTRKTMK